MKHQLPHQLLKSLLIYKVFPLIMFSVKLSLGMINVISLIAISYLFKNFLHKISPINLLHSIKTVKIYLIFTDFLLKEVIRLGL